MDTKYRFHGRLSRGRRQGGRRSNGRSSVTIPIKQPRTRASRWCTDGQPRRGPSAHRTVASRGTLAVTLARLPRPSAEQSVAVAHTGCTTRVGPTPPRTGATGRSGQVAADIELPGGVRTGNVERNHSRRPKIPKAMIFKGLQLNTFAVRLIFETLNPEGGSQNWNDGQGGRWHSSGDLAPHAAGSGHAVDPVPSSSPGMCSSSKTSPATSSLPWETASYFGGFQPQTGAELWVMEER